MLYLSIYGITYCLLPYDYMGSHPTLVLILTQDQGQGSISCQEGVSLEDKLYFPLNFESTRP